LTDFKFGENYRSMLSTTFDTCSRSLGQTNRNRYTADLRSVIIV